MVALDPGDRLAELVHEAQRLRGAIREFWQAGYNSMVDHHRVRLADVQAQIRQHCADHALELPPEVRRRR